MGVRKECIFLADLFSLYCEAILSELQVLSRFSGQNLKTERQTDYKVYVKHYKIIGPPIKASKKQEEERINNELLKRQNAWLLVKKSLKKVEKC